ncbi:helix-turn-helix domain-containing protein [Actinomadura litoris]|uniref:helix-turn-helix domain-containing protein n=1 Tax=Actinomadura litoris TaxID=2678616 RepID=UPI001FA7ED46|nr:helix-turn-helix domain-containing protein [Actinomadura litoris]
MGDVVAAREAYEAAQKEALRIVERARHELGRVIREARAQGISQEEIRRELKLTREQVRRFQREYEKANDLSPLGGRQA